MIIALLTILLYAILAVLILEIAFYIVGLLIPVPPKIRQLVYALVGVLFIIQIVQLFLGGSPFFPLPSMRH